MAKFNVTFNDLMKASRQYRIAAKVGLRYSGNNVIDTFFACVYCRNTQKKQVASGNKRVGKCIFGLFLIHANR